MQRTDDIPDGSRRSGMDRPGDPTTGTDPTVPDGDVDQVRDDERDPLLPSREAEPGGPRTDPLAAPDTEGFSRPATDRSAPDPDDPDRVATGPGFDRSDPERSEREPSDLDRPGPYLPDSDLPDSDLPDSDRTADRRDADLPRFGRGVDERGAEGTDVAGADLAGPDPERGDTSLGTAAGTSGGVRDDVPTATVGSGTTVGVAGVPAAGNAADQARGTEAPADLASTETGTEAPATAPAETAGLPAEPGDNGAHRAADRMAVRLFAVEVTERYNDRWHEVQASFVDDPAQAVRSADELVSDLVKALTSAVADRQRELSGQHTGGDSATEELRTTLMRYRGIVHRLLEV